MNLEWKPDTAVAVLLFFDRLVSILSAARHQPLLLSHSFIDPFHDPQNVTPNTINGTFMVSLRTAVAGLVSIEQSAHLMCESLADSHESMRRAPQVCNNQLTHT